MIIAQKVISITTETTNTTQDDDYLVIEKIDEILQRDSTEGELVDTETGKNCEILRLEEENATLRESIEKFTTDLNEVLTVKVAKGNG